MTKFKAVMPDGSVMCRTSRTRFYTHAWRVVYDQVGRGRDSVGGFAGSEELARKAGESHRRQAEAATGYTVVSVDVAPAVEG